MKAQMIKKLLFFLLLFYFHAYAIVLVDIRETTFGSTYEDGSEKKGTKISMPAGVVFETREDPVPSPKQVRLAFFDAAKYKYQEVLYLMTPREDEEYTYKVPHSSGKGTNIKIKYTRDEDDKLEITVTPKKLDNEYWYFLPQAVKDVPKGFVCEKFKGDKTREECWLLRPKGDDFLPRKDLLKYIKNGLGDRSKHEPQDFNITFYLDELFKDYILSGNAGIKKDEKACQLVGPYPKSQELGLLGELATDLYFFLHGYKKMLSKVDGDSDHGWDHIFVDDLEEPDVVCIVETKFQEEFSSNDASGYIGKKFKVVKRKRGVKGGPGILEKMVREGRERDEEGLLYSADLISRLLIKERKKLRFIGLHIRKDGVMRAPYYSRGHDIKRECIPDYEHAEKDADKAKKLLDRWYPEDAGEHLATAKAKKSVGGASSDEKVVSPRTPFPSAKHGSKEVGIAALPKAPPIPKETGDPKATFSHKDSDKPAGIEGVLPTKDEYSLPIAVGNIAQRIGSEGRDATKFLEAVALIKSETSKYEYMFDLKPIV